MEPGSAPGTWRFSLTTLYGTDFEGGHFSTGGNASDGSAVTVPLYRHEVSLDYARVELALDYTVAPQWELTLRMPFESKRQQSSIGFVEPATPAQREAMQRNADIHHRSVTLRGISDLMLLGRHRRASVWREGDALSISAGITLPTGNTVENPYRLGEAGQEHLHIQFGTGTFDPLLEASYTAPLFGRLSAGAYLAGRAPLYENGHGFQAPPDATLGAHLSHRASDRLLLRLEAAGYVQGYGKWDGSRDENTGLLATSLTGGATMRFGERWISADVRVPVSQRTLTEGDAFTQGPTFVVSVGGPLRR